MTPVVERADGHPVARYFHLVGLDSLAVVEPQADSREFAAAVEFAEPSVSSAAGLVWSPVLLEYWLKSLSSADPKLRLGMRRKET